MRSSSLLAKFCTNGSYYGVPLKLYVVQKTDPLCPDAAAQSIAAWSYVAFVTLIVILCCVSPYFRRVKSLISSTGSDVFMVTFLIFIVLGYSATPDIGVFWITSSMVTVISGIAFLIYGNFKFFMALPTVDSVWEQLSTVPEISSICEELPSDSSTVDAGNSDDNIVTPPNETEEGSGTTAKNYQPSCHMNPLGAKYHKIQFVIGFLTFAIVTIEMVFAIALAAHMPCKSCAMEITSSVILMIQKIVQAVVYASISRKLAKPELIFETIYYLNIIGLINFALWVDSLAFAQYSEALEASKKSYKEPFEILEVLYEALVADYRLLCSALFIEHAQDLREEFNVARASSDVEKTVQNDEVTVPVIMYSVDEEHYRYLGFGAGFAVIGVEILKNLKHVGNLHLPPAFGLVGTVTQLVLIGSVMLFIHNNPKEGRQEKSAVRFLVACMGSIGLCYFLFRFLLNLHWVGGSYAAIKEDAIWDAVNCGGKCLYLFFLLLLFLHTEDEVITKNYYSKINQFLLPFLTVGIFGMFLGSLVEFHESKLDKTVICRTQSTSLATLFTAAPPLYLGFLMHSFAKMYMVSKHAKKRNIKVKKNSSRTMLEERLLP